MGEAGHMKRLRVLHIADALHGGGAESVFRATIEVSRKFASEVSVYTATGRTTPLGYVYSWRNRRNVLSWLRGFRPDVVHVQNYYHSLSPSVLSALRVYKKRNPGLRVVFTAHDYHLACPNSGMQYFPRGVRTNVGIDERPVRLLRMYDHRSWFHAALKIAQFTVAYRLLRLQRVIDEIVSPSQFLAQALEGAQLQGRISVLRNPLTLRGTDGRKVEPVGEHRAGIANLGFVGRLVPEKGLEELIRALARISQTTPAELHVFGEGPQRAELERLAAVLGMASSVAFYGQRSHADTWSTVSTLDALVVPSIWYENAPQIVLEAAAVGVPVIGNDIGGVAEMCGEVTHAQTCNTADSGDLERAIRAVRGDRRINSLRHPEDYTPGYYERELRRIYAGESSLS